MAETKVALTELTENEQNFASDNHYIVERFLRHKHLDQDEYYDIVIFGYLRAVKNYVQRGDLQKYSFSTIAYFNMKCTLSNYYDKKQRRMKIAHFVSIDRPVYEDGLSITEYAIKPDLVAEYLEAENMWNSIVSNIPGKYVDVLRMKVEGYSNIEIAKIKGVSSQYIYYIMKVIRETVVGIRAAGAA
jgi:RNA polymerase sigma-70 factor (ECF subfamily)